MNWKDQIDKAHKGQTGFFKQLENINKMVKLKHIGPRVKAVLQQNVTSRDDDNKLTAIIWHRELLDKGIDANKLTAQGQQNKLAKLSGGDPTKAVNIIMQSIENNWVGLFDLKTETNEQQTNTPDELKAVVNRLVERHNARNGA